MLLVARDSHFSKAFGYYANIFRKQLRTWKSDFYAYLGLRIILLILLNSAL